MTPIFCFWGKKHQYTCPWERPQPQRYPYALKEPSLLRSLWHHEVLQVRAHHWKGFIPQESGPNPSVNSQLSKMKSGKFSAKVGSRSSLGSVQVKMVSANTWEWCGIVSKIVSCSSFDSIFTRNPKGSPLEMTWTPNFSRTTLYRLPRRTFFLRPANSTIPQVLQHPSCSLSGPSSAKFVETLSVSLIQFCPESALTGSGALSETSYSPIKYLSPTRSYSNTQLNSSSSLMEVYKDTEHASMLVPM